MRKHRINRAVECFHAIFCEGVDFKSKVVEIDGLRIMLQLWLVQLSASHAHWDATTVFLVAGIRPGRRDFEQ